MSLNCVTLFDFFVPIENKATFNKIFGDEVVLFNEFNAPETLMKDMCGILKIPKFLPPSKYKEFHDDPFYSILLSEIESQSDYLKCLNLYETLSPKNNTILFLRTTSTLDNKFVITIGTSMDESSMIHIEMILKVLPSFCETENTIFSYIHNICVKEMFQKFYATFDVTEENSNNKNSMSNFKLLLDNLRYSNWFDSSNPNRLDFSRKVKVTCEVV